VTFNISHLRARCLSFCFSGHSVFFDIWHLRGSVVSLSLSLLAIANFIPSQQHLLLFFLLILVLWPWKLHTSFPKVRMSLGGHTIKTWFSRHAAHICKWDTWCNRNILEHLLDWSAKGLPVLVFNLSSKLFQDSMALCPQVSLSMRCLSWTTTSSQNKWQWTVQGSLTDQSMEKDIRQAILDFLACSRKCADVLLCLFLSKRSQHWHQGKEEGTQTEHAWCQVQSSTPASQDGVQMQLSVVNWSGIGLMCPSQCSLTA